VAVLHRSLQKHGFNAAALHGDMDQRARMAALESFRAGETTVLVASDVAARGLDIPAVSHVFNYDVPHHAEDYVHRIGRTGRAGRTGFSFTLIGPGDEKSLGAIERLIKQPIEWEGPTVAERPASSEGRPASRRDRERDGTRTRVRGRSRRGSNEGREAPIETEASSPAPRERAPERERAAPVSRPSERPERSERHGGRPNRRTRDDDGPDVVGFGDHVPAFLLPPGSNKRGE
jgi:superfamily II DNA/RNA helicase